MSEDKVVVTAKKVVSFHYTLTDPDGKQLDTSEGDDPLVYLHGAGNIVSGLERQLDGRSVGDSVHAVVPPEEGYGTAEGPGAQVVPRSAFPEGVELQVGMSFVAEGPDGQDIPLWITALDDEQVQVDTNHPLAGVELHFKVDIVGIRDASEEEVAHGHPHGPGGHHHD